MYKALARSHLDYRDIIYHIPSRQTQVGVTLNALLEKTGRLPIPSSSCCHRCMARSMRNWDGNHYLVVVDVGAFCKYIKIASDRSPSYLKNKLLRLF